MEETPEALVGDDLAQQVMGRHTVAHACGLVLYVAAMVGLVRLLNWLGSFFGGLSKENSIPRQRE